MFSAHVMVLQHNTCPICRKTLGTLDAADADEQEPHVGIHEVTDSDSTDSSDNDEDSNCSNDEQPSDSAVVASSLAADGAEDAVADVPTESAVDVADCALWDIRPDGAMRLSVARQMEQDDHRCSSSSSSEYSSL